MKRKEIIEKTYFSTHDEIIKALNEGEIVMVKILVDECICADFDVYLENEDEPYEENTNDIIIAYDSAEDFRCYDAEDFYIYNREIVKM